MTCFADSRPFDRILRSALSGTLAVCLACNWALSAAAAAELQYPLSIAVADDGQMYLADRNLPGVFRAQDGKLSVLFQASKRFKTPLNAVRCVALDREGKLLAGDSAARNVFRFNDEGQPEPITRVTDGLGLVGIPMDVAVNSQGDIFTSDLEIQRIVKIPHGGDEPEEVAEISGCRGLFMDAKDRLWVVSTTNDQLYRIGPTGEKEVIVPGRPFEFPHTVVVTDDDTAYVCDGYAKAIWRVPPEGVPEKLVAGEPFDNPVGLALHDNQLYVADPRARAVFRVDLEGKVSRVPLQSAE